MAYHLGRNAFVKERRVAEIKPGNVPTQGDVRCLMIASTFAPIHGGSAVVYENLCLHMPPNSIRVLAAKHNYLNNKPLKVGKRTISRPLIRFTACRCYAPLMQAPPANSLVSAYRLLFNDLPSTFIASGLQRLLCASTASTLSA